MLHAAAQTLAEFDVEERAHMIEERPADAILGVAQREHADLIVVGFAGPRSQRPRTVGQRLDEGCSPRTLRRARCRHPLTDELDSGGGLDVGRPWGAFAVSDALVNVTSSVTSAPNQSGRSKAAIDSSESNSTSARTSPSNSSWKTSISTIRLSSARRWRVLWIRRPPVCSHAAANCSAVRSNSSSVRTAPRPALTVSVLRRGPLRGPSRNVAVDGQISLAERDALIAKFRNLGDEEFALPFIVPDFGGVAGGVWRSSSASSAIPPVGSSGSLAHGAVPIGAHPTNEGGGRLGIDGRPETEGTTAEVVLLETGQVAGVLDVVRCPRSARGRR